VALDEDGRPDTDGRTASAEARIRHLDSDGADVGALEGVHPGEAGGQGRDVGRTHEELLLELDEARQVEEERVVADAGEGFAATVDVGDPES